MARRNGFVIDKKLAAEMSGREKLRALIVARSGTIQKWAGENGLWPIQVTQTLSGNRENLHIRDRMAEAFGLPRDEVDALIDDEPDDEAASA